MRTRELYRPPLLRLLLAAAILGLPWPGAQAPAQQNATAFFVAPAGADANPGTREKPFATPARAQRAVREKIAAGAKGSIDVILGKGHYVLDAPLIFTPQDSGAEQTPVTWKAAPGDKAELSGGVRLTGWKQNAQGHWELQLPEVRQGKWAFSQLFVNGQRRLRPRLPKEGSYFIEKTATPKPGQDKASHDRLHFYRDDIRPDWRNLGDVEAVIFHTWSASRMRIKSVDPQARVATLTAVCGREAPWSGLREGRRYFFENVREALDEPGQWYLDRPSGLLTYLPLPGEKIGDANVIAPRLSHLLKIEANVTKGEIVEHLRFENLTFAHTNFVLPPQGFSVAQADITLDGAIRLDGARHCVFQGCTVRHVAGYGIQFNTGCTDNRVEDCDIYDLGGGGVQIGAKVASSWWFGDARFTNLPKTDDVMGGRNTVRNCTIAHGGRLFPAAVGVWIGDCGNNHIAQNHIHDFFYTGISPGWLWGYKESYAGGNIIEYNHIHDIGQRVLSDMGGIYTLSPCRGTVLRYNHIHDVFSYGYGGWGIYFDEGTSNIVAENNLAYRVKDGGFHQHYGRDNRVENNIFAFSEEAQVKRSRLEDHRSFWFVRNIVYWKDAPLFGANTDGKGGKSMFLDYNCYWQEGGAKFDFAGKSLEDWRKTGQDLHSIVADPGFVDPAHGDFTLKPDSPALQLGFKPFDVSTAGRTSPSRIPPDLPRPATAFLKNLPHQKPPPRAVAENFDNLKAGAKPPRFTLEEENKQAVIRVTDETAASGKHSLKLTDAPGQKYGHNPHMYLDPNYTTGHVTGGFKIRLGERAYIYSEWRTAGSPYKVGPSLHFTPGGALISHGKKLLDCPRDVWIAIDIACTLGAGNYDLTVTLPGQPPQIFKALPCDPKFTELRWFGFTANGQEAAEMFLDDIHLELR